VTEPAGRQANGAFDGVEVASVVPSGDGSGGVAVCRQKPSLPFTQPGQKSEQAGCERDSASASR